MSRKALQIILTVFGLSLAYAVVRYHVFESVPYSDFPLYVLNKTFALSAITLLALTFGLGPAKALGADVPDEVLKSRKETGIASFVLALAHMLCALLLFGTGGYYGKFFGPEGSLNAVGSWSMLFGVLTFVWLWLYNISFKVHQEGDRAFQQLVTSRGSLLVGALLAAGHVGVMGYRAWFQPGTWSGGMPPITLVAFAALLLALITNIRGRR